MPEIPHFISVADLEEAADHLGFVPLGHRFPQEPKAVRIHVRDHRGREVVPTLETFYVAFALSQQRPAPSSQFGSPWRNPTGQTACRRKSMVIRRPRQPFVVTWADGEFFLMLASDQQPLANLLAIAGSLYE